MRSGEGSTKIGIFNLIFKRLGLTVDPLRRFLELAHRFCQPGHLLSHGRLPHSDLDPDAVQVRFRFD